jgi:hypothetical protein
MLVRKRYGNQLQDIKGFIRPNELFYYQNGQIKNALTEALALGADCSIWCCWKWVAQNIQYPVGSPEVNDYHHQDAFPGNRPFALANLLPAESATAFDFWEYPFELLEPPMIGDCEERAFLLCSMLRNSLAAQDIWVAMGLWGTQPHAWVSLPREGTRYALETTLLSIPSTPWQIPEQYPYHPIIYFNDESILPLEPIPDWLVGLTPAIRSSKKVAAIRLYYSGIGI